MIGEPLAIFVVERKPGQGYCVSSSQGRETERLREQAVRILDELGQPDPRGPEEVHRWVGPIGSSNHFVGVTIRRLPSGEVSYTQSWFSSRTAISVTRRLRWRTVFLLVISALVGGILCGWALHPERDTDAVLTPNSEGIKLTRPVSSASEASVAALKTKTLEARVALEKIRRYFQQERLLPKPNETVVEPSSSVRLNSNFSFGALKENHLDLNNVEVQSLLDVVTALLKSFPEASVKKN